MTRAILVTGANRGIGLALTKEFAIRGWRVIACCRRPGAAQNLRKEATERSDLISIERLDVTDTFQVRELAGKLRHQSLDILFNNAGQAGPRQQDFGDLDEARWLETFKVNTIAPLRMAEAFVTHVAQSERRIIATMGSVMGSIGENESGGYYVYRTTKAAVHMVMRNLAMDLQPLGIIAVALHPIWVRTEMGGREATLSAEESAAGLYEVLDCLEPEQSGSFLDYRGRVLPW